jgi:hypothetical protein
MHEPILKLVDLLTIAALVLGPVLAVQVQKFIDRTKEVKNRRLWVFKTLMATRHATLSTDHVAALNRIDLEFDDRRFHNVLEAWRQYFDNLSTPGRTEHEVSVWISKNDDLLAELLFQMGQSLGFKFDRSQIRRNVYSPRWHSKVENDNNAIREKLIEVFDGKRAIPLDVQQVAWNENMISRQSSLQDKQSKLWDLMIEHYTRENEKSVAK